MSLLACETLPTSEPLRFGDTIALAAVDAGGYLCCDAGLTSRCFVDHVSHFDSKTVVRSHPPICPRTDLYHGGLVGKPLSRREMHCTNVSSSQHPGGAVGINSLAALWSHIRVIVRGHAVRVINGDGGIRTSVSFL
jgi:hypothetical protein